MENLPGCVGEARSDGWATQSSGARNGPAAKPEIIGGRSCDDGGALIDLNNPEGTTRRSAAEKRGNVEYPERIKRSRQHFGQTNSELAARIKAMKCIKMQQTRPKLLIFRRKRPDSGNVRSPMRRDIGFWQALRLLARATGGTGGQIHQLYSVEKHNDANWTLTATVKESQFTMRAPNTDQPIGHC